MPVLLRTAIFRRTAALSAGFALALLLVFGMIYWRTAIVETARVDRVMALEAATVAQDTPEEVERAVRSRLAVDLERVGFAGLFDPSGRPIAGNLARPFASVPADGIAHGVSPADQDGVAKRSIRAVATRLPDGRILVIGRDVAALANLRHVVADALAWGVTPGLAFALIGGAIAGRRSADRARRMHQALARIRTGALSERLPLSARDDEFDELAVAVNGLLDEMAALIERLHGIGDDIAHDLRTPLARLRMRLEQARRLAGDGATASMMDGAVSDLDRASGLIDALLRLAEIESGRRQAAFVPVSLDAMAADVIDFFAPIAETRRVALLLDADIREAVPGDAALLAEALSNLVDNAVKVSPPGAAVSVVVRQAEGRASLRVIDRGPGIREEDRRAVLQRFFRADKARHLPGNGLGLSVAQAIARLHGGEVSIETPPAGASVVLSVAADARANVTRTNHHLAAFGS